MSNFCSFLTFLSVNIDNNKKIHFCVIILLSVEKTKQANQTMWQQTQCTHNTSMSGKI